MSRKTQHHYVHPDVDTPQVYVDKALVRELRRRFPVQVAAPGTTLDTLMYSGGQQSIIDMLEGLAEEAEARLRDSATNPQ